MFLVELSTTTNLSDHFFFYHAWEEIGTSVERRDEELKKEFLKKFSRMKASLLVSIYTM